MVKIGQIRVNTQNSGVVKLPVFEPGDIGNGVYEVVRIYTSNGIGVIPFTDPNDAAYQFLKIQTDNKGVLAVHDKSYISLEGTESFEHGSIHMNDLNFVSDWTGNTGYISNTSDSISGSKSLYMKVANTGEKEVTCSIDSKPKVFEWKYKWNVLSTGSLGDYFRIVLTDKNGEFIAGIRTEIDDTPEGDDQVVQPKLRGNNSYDLFLDQNTVYKMKIVFDWSSETFDFYLDDNLKFSDISWYGNPSDFSKVKIKLEGDADANDWEKWLDDVYIKA